MATLHMVGRSLISKVNVGSSQAALVVKNLPANAGDERDADSIPGEDPLEEGMATHSSILVWRIPWTEKSGQLQSTGSQRVGHDWSDLAWKVGEEGWEEKKPREKEKKERLHQEHLWIYKKKCVYISLIIHVCVCVQTFFILGQKDNRPRMTISYEWLPARLRERNI